MTDDTTGRHFGGTTTCPGRLGQDGLSKGALCDTCGERFPNAYRRVLDPAVIPAAPRGALNVLECTSLNALAQHLRKARQQLVGASC